MKRKRLFAPLLILCLFIGIFSGCGGAAQSTSEGKSETSSSEAEANVNASSPVESEINRSQKEIVASTAESNASAAENDSNTLEFSQIQLVDVQLPLFEDGAVELSLWTSLPFFMEGMVGNMGTDLYLLSQIQKDCNFTLDVKSVTSTNESEQFNLMIASGDYTDIFSGLSYYPNGYDAAVTNDIVINLIDLAPEYAPNYWAYVNSSDDIRATLITDDGALPTIATIYKERGAENRGLLYRKDWLDALGLEEPRTYTELHDFLLKCNEQYGSQGLCLTGRAMGGTAGAESVLSYGYDFTIGGYNVIDGKVVYSYLNDNLYKYLSLLNEWYSDGAIVSEFYNLETSEGDQGVPNGKYVMTISSAANLSTMEAYADAGAVYTIGGLPAPTDGSGNSLHYRWTDDSSSLKRRDTWAVSTACNNPEAVLQIANYMFSDAGQLFFNYGTEGYTFTYNEEGKPQYTDLILNNPDYAEGFARYIYVSNVATEYLPSVMDVTAGYWYFGEDEWKIFDLFRDCEADGSYNLSSGVTLNEEENEEYARIASDVETYVNTELLRFITTPDSVTEETVAAFQDTVRNMGGGRMEELYQSAYERYLQKINN